MPYLFDEHSHMIITVTGVHNPSNRNPILRYRNSLPYLIDEHLGQHSLQIDEHDHVASRPLIVVGHGSELHRGQVEVRS